jgi:D-alanine--poly(phosphoribitol) ligase subunit 1
MSLPPTFLRASLSGLSPKDRVYFERFGRGEQAPPRHSNILAAFEEQAARRPLAVAARHGDQSISYGELNHEACLLAEELRRRGVLPGDHVGLFVQRSIPMLVGLLATLKCGAAYVPQDARIATEAQLAHVATTANTRLILSLSALIERMPRLEGREIVAIDDFLAAAQRGPGTIPSESAHVSGSATCFVLFTSGTTGMPNGVAVTHANLCNILLTAPGNLGMAPGMKVSQILNIAFDMAAWEILGALAHGAMLLIRGADIAATVKQADIVIATPSILAALDESACRNVRTVALAGEPCPKPLADRWASFCAFYNACGPTEVTIVNTMQRYTADSKRLSIGRPTPNNTVYVLDEALRPCPIGEVGEMWAGGDCVSAGYLGDDKRSAELNADRYRPDPFLGGGRRMFRTRDLGRWTPEGELEHLGRTDDQVKIRGFRVELDSVSACIEAVEYCAQAITLKLDSRNLVTFVRPSKVDTVAARRAVAEKLPYYCTPTLVIALDEFPITSRGKVDKRALTIMAVALQDKNRARSAPTREGRDT